MTPSQTHVVLIKPCYGALIATGTKTVEIRLSQNRIAPYGLVHPGDTLYFRATGGRYMARATCDWVETHSDLNKTTLSELAQLHSGPVAAPNSFWNDREQPRYATVIGLVNAVATTLGPDYAQLRTPGSRKAWYLLSPDHDLRLSAA